MSSTGEIQWIGVDNDEELPEAQAFIDMLTETFPPQSPNGVLEAIGVCYDARVRPPGQSDKSDAICCNLDHKSGSDLETRTAVADGSPNGRGVSSWRFLTRHPTEPPTHSHSLTCPTFSPKISAQ